MTSRPVDGVLRRVCSGCERVHYVDPKISVGVAVFHDDQLLLVRRRMNPGQGRWTVPGGYVDIGQDPRAEAAREVAEETGVEVDVGDVIDVFLNPPEEGSTVFLLFQGRWVRGEPVAGDDADEAAFVGRDDLPPLAFASTLAAVARWPAPGGE